MDILRTRDYSKQNQYVLSTLLIALTAFICYLSTGIIDYKAVALILLLVVSLNAILFDILPVLLSAFLSALVWNFFFIPPTLTLHIGTPEDALMFLMYFVIASINAVLTHKIREAESKARDKEEKENTIRLYDTLLNSLSHELRTPIAAIIGAVDTLKDPNNKLSESNKHELLNQLEIASTRLNRQVENLLNMSRLESGMLKLTLDWCDVNELLFSVVSEVQKLSTTDSNHHIIFSQNEQLPLLKVDAGLLEQVFQNILYNAIQHTPDHSVIKMNATYLAGNCIVTISDNGSGFPENEMQFVFDEFNRLPKSRVGGSGLGLSISKGFTEAHHGQLRLQNNSEGGALFTVIIPAESSFINNLKNE